MGCGCREEGIEVLSGGVTIAQRISKRGSVDHVATVALGVTTFDPVWNCILYGIGERLEYLGGAELPFFRHLVGYALMELGRLLGAASEDVVDRLSCCYR